MQATKHLDRMGWKTDTLERWLIMVKTMGCKVKGSGCCCGSA